MKLLYVGVVLAATTLAVTACGGGGAKSSTPNAPTVQLTADDIPDVLMLGIWPGAGLKVSRQGSSITVKTNWTDNETTVDGRTTLDAAQIINDYEIGRSVACNTFSIQVLASNGWEHLAFRGNNGKCHTS
jgi:hypothetical protein